MKYVFLDMKTKMSENKSIQTAGRENNYNLVKEGSLGVHIAEICDN